MLEISGFIPFCGRYKIETTKKNNIEIRFIYLFFLKIRNTNLNQKEF